jgi:hypothetical protein
VAIGAMNVLAHRRLWSAASVAVFAAGVLAGLSPLIFSKVTHSWSNLKHILMIGMRETPPAIPGKIYSLFTVELPRFFQARNVDAIVAAPLSAWIEYLICLGLITWFVAVHLVALGLYLLRGLAAPVAAIGNSKSPLPSLSSEGGW